MVIRTFVLRSSSLIRLHYCSIVGAFLFLFTGLTVEAQLIVDNTITPEQAIANLLGGGVEVINIEFSGDLNQVGIFNGANSNLGMDAGVILGTGDVNFASVGNVGNVPGGNNQNGGSLGGLNFGAGDPDLQAISGVGMNDAAILEFDFVALGEEISFQYIFGSEEYNDYACATVNDAFGFFLSGPGINGPFTDNAVNLALVPGTDIPVTINSVNLGVPGIFGNAPNCAAYSPNWADNAVYFINNPPPNANPQVIQYDGFTVVLEASASVICGETYHIKLAIADGGDTSFDSGVFLLQGSFDSAGVTISADLTNTVDENTIHENCGSATITFERIGNVELPYTLDIAYSGTALPGVNYVQLPEVVEFEAGQSELTIEVVPIPNGAGAGLLELIIEVTTVGCDGETTTFSLFINDDPVVVDIAGDAPVCPGDLVNVGIEVSGGVEPYTIAWSTGDDGLTTAVNFEQSTLVTVDVTDACDVTETASFFVNVPQPDDLDVIIDGLFAVDCPDVQLLDPLVGGGTQPYEFAWFEDGAQFSDEQNVFVEIDEDRMVEFIVTDFCGVETAVEIDLLITDHPPVEVTMTDDPEICYGEQTGFQVQVEGGFGPWSIEWEHNGSAQWSQSVQPPRTTTYPYVLTDGCGDTLHHELTVWVYTIEAGFTFEYVGVNEVAFTNTSSGNVFNEWTFGDGATSDEEDPVHTYLNFDTYTPVTLWVENEFGCRDVAREVLAPLMTAFVPNAFTPDNDGINEVFKFELIGVQSFEFWVFNRWGEQVFYTDERGKFWNGSVNGGDHYAPDGVYVWILEMTGFESNVERLTGSVTIIR